MALPSEPMDPRAKKTTNRKRLPIAFQRILFGYFENHPLLETLKARGMQYHTSEIANELYGRFEMRVMDPQAFNGLGGVSNPHQLVEHLPDANGNWTDRQKPLTRLWRFSLDLATKPDWGDASYIYPSKWIKSCMLDRPAQDFALSPETWDDWCRDYLSIIIAYLDLIIAFENILKPIVAYNSHGRSTITIKKINPKDFNVALAALNNDPQHLKHLDVGPSVRQKMAETIDHYNDKLMGSELNFFE